MRLPASNAASNLDSPSALTAASLARAKSGMAGPAMPAPALDPTACRGPEQLCRQAWVPGHGGMPAQQAQQVVLGEPVIDLPRDPQRLEKPRLRCRHITGQHRGLAQVLKHLYEVVEVTCLPAEPRALGGSGLGGVEVSLEERMDGPAWIRPIEAG